jgi:hypothetical protein
MSVARAGADFIVVAAATKEASTQEQHKQRVDANSSQEWTPVCTQKGLAVLQWTPEVIHGPYDHIDLLGA